MALKKSQVFTRSPAAELIVITWLSSEKHRLDDMTENDEARRHHQDDSSSM